jgi:tRNA-Thr(GGU) m(6)t(6)A37 methyltransferase TsaA
MHISYSPIGYFKTPHTTIEDMPIQPRGAVGIRGTVSVNAEYAEGLADLDGFSHVIVLYHFHKVTSHALTVVPFLDTQSRGVFATRSPKRPNSIGLSVMRLVSVRGCELELENVDVLDGTPVLDIKPYVPGFDVWPVEQVGWLEKGEQDVEIMRSDDRFKD